MLDLAATSAEVARLGNRDRQYRVQLLMDEAHDLLDQGIAAHIHEAGKKLAGVAVLFSGGNDSTVLAHLFRQRATHAIHANTGIGVEETREFVRQTCASWGLPLIEKHPPAGSTYRELVLERGFPGPAQHFKMYQRLKERALRQARRELVTDRSQRVVFLAGRRRDESARRAMVPSSEREGSVVWVSPLVHWTKPDMVTYRLMQGDVPRNEVADLLHMSGECLCGAFAEKGELEEIGAWYPQVRADIEQLEQDAVAAGIQEPRCHWGWGAYRADFADLRARSQSGPLCTSCDARASGGEIVAV